MRPIKHTMKGKEELLLCFHWKNFPPPCSFLNDDPEKVRDSVSPAEYQQYLVYLKVCGLREMHPLKCLDCPHVRKLAIVHGRPHMVTLAGKSPTPIGQVPNTTPPARSKESLK
jgi:hypothetical protein